MSSRFGSRLTTSTRSWRAATWTTGPIGPATCIRSSLPSSSEVTAEHAGTVVRLQASGSIGPVVQAATRHELIDLISREPNLEDIFLAHYGGD